MHVSSPIDDVDAYPTRLWCCARGFGKCRSIRHLLCVTCVLMGEVARLWWGYAQSASSEINGTITDQSARSSSGCADFSSRHRYGYQRITTTDRARVGIRERYPRTGRLAAGSSLMLRLIDRR
jgi:hypothetical protein